jgi:ubiquinone biosynthesis protein
VLLTDDGRLALIDLGMTARLTSKMQERLVRLLVGIGEGNVELVTEATIAISTTTESFERDPYAGDVADLLGRIAGAGMADLEVGELVAEVARLSVQHGLRPPPELALLGKTLLNLDEVARRLSPGFDPNASVRGNVAEIMSRRLWREATPGSALNLMIDAKEFVEELPGRMNRILDTLASGQLHVEVDAVDEQQLMRMFQKVANRVTAGLVLAALIIGASMLVQVETDHTILGYPALAIVLFLGAVAAGFGLLLTILFSDEHRRLRRRR